MKQQERWDRAAFAFRTRPNRAPRDIDRGDLMITRGPSNLKMLGMTLAGGIAMALIYVWPVLTILSILLSQPPGNWYWVTLLVFAGVFWISLFAMAVRESAADRRFLRQLGLPS